MRRIRGLSGVLIVRSMLLPVVLALALTLVMACGDDEGDDGGGNGGEETATAGALNPDDFEATVDNQFLPLQPGTALVYEGEEEAADTGETIKLRVESTVLEETDTVAGIEVTVVQVMDFEDGDLVESTLDYYAQHKDGTVYYLGERVDDYEDGEIVGHGGQWLTGEGGAQAAYSCRPIRRSAMSSSRSRRRAWRRTSPR